MKKILSNGWVLTIICIMYLVGGAVLFYQMCLSSIFDVFWQTFVANNNIGFWEIIGIKAAAIGVLVLMYIFISIVKPYLDDDSPMWFLCPGIGLCAAQAAVLIFEIFYW